MTPWGPDVVALTLFGLMVGSFLNVVIARVPERRSVWKPRSACPGCGAPIAWHDNVPVLSYVALRARCRACGMSISWRYPVVEIANTILWLLAYATFGRSFQLLVALAFLSALLAVTAIDLQHQIIPNVITLPGIVAGFVANLATGHVSWLDSLLGITVGGGLFLVIILGSAVALGQEGMGRGDMKLGAMFGAFLGWKVALLSIFVGVLCGGLAAMALMALGVAGRKTPIPFGPFLAVGGAIGLLWGERLVAWYLSGFIG